MIERTTIKNFHGVILGYIEVNTDTKIETAKSFFGEILGRYNPFDNTTRDFFGAILSYGNTLSGLIYNQKDR